MLINDYTVSDEHARLNVIPQLRRVLLSDLGSTNGTAHNGVLMECERKILLASGDSVCFGRMSMAFFSAVAFHRYLRGQFEWKEDQLAAV